MSVEDLAESACQKTTSAELTHCIVQVGTDADLLSYREQVLRWAGWHVLSRRPQEVTKAICENNVGLCIACHTLTSSERTFLANTVREHCPSTRLLAIVSAGTKNVDMSAYDDLIDNLDGPAALIRKVRQQLGLLPV